MLKNLKEKSLATAKKMKDEHLSKDALNIIKTSADIALKHVKSEVSKPQLSEKDKEIKILKSDRGIAKQVKLEVSESQLSDKNEGMETSKSEQSLTKQKKKEVSHISQNKTELTTQSIVERMLDVNLPNWIELKKQSEKIISNKRPDCVVEWIDSELPISKKHIKKGRGYYFWNDRDQLILNAKPSIWEKIIFAILSLFFALLAPWYAIRNGIERILERIAEKLGSFFFIFSLPTALIAFLGDLFSMVVEQILSIPRLLLSPLTFIRSVILFIPTLLTKLIARLLWAFLLPIIGKLLNGLKTGKAEKIKELMTKHKWIRYVLLGFFRKEKPLGSVVLIPTKNINQVFRVKRKGIFNRGEYLIVVEGEKLVKGFMNRFKSWFLTLMFPFYWERTVHMIRLPKEPVAQDEVINLAFEGINLKIHNWND